MKQLTLKFNKKEKSNFFIIFIKDDKAIQESSFLSADQKKYAKENKDLSHFTFLGSDKRLLVVKSGKNAEENRKRGNEAFNIIKSLKQFEWNCQLFEIEDNNFSFLEGLCLSAYSFNKYKSEDKNLAYAFNVLDGLNNKSIEELSSIIKSVFVARDLVNEPHSYLNAVQFAKDIEKLGKEYGFDVKVWDKKKIVKEKMGGILAVNKGSIQEPTFSIMTYKPKKAINKKPYILVGKGVVFDTGGLSLKPTPNSMDLMKSDMGGSAAVVGAMCALAAQKLNLYVIGLVPATDNRPGLDAIVPSDVITMYSGKTVEVLNTDAEGRLILADALHYAKQFDPELVIDLATLTGAAARAIGPYGIAGMGTAKSKTMNALQQAGESVHERVIEFPMWEEYEKSIQSDIADINNLGGPFAGHVTAGMFLKHFTDYPWIHLDIAGMAFLKAADTYRGKNGTGVGVRLLYQFLKNREEEK